MVPLLLANSSDKLLHDYNWLNSVFESYCFELQQFESNDKKVEQVVGKINPTPASDKPELLGLVWDKANDTLSVKKKWLNPSASTKRSVLATIASYFDPYSFDGHILNRARFFMHSLQLQKDLSWDQSLSVEQCREWKNICSELCFTCGDR